MSQQTYNQGRYASMRKRQHWSMENMHMKLIIHVSSQTPAVIFINQQNNKPGRYAQRGNPNIEA